MQEKKRWRRLLKYKFLISILYSDHIGRMAKVLHMSKTEISYSTKWRLVICLHQTHTVSCHTMETPLEEWHTKIQLHSRGWAHSCSYSCIHIVRSHKHKLAWVVHLQVSFSDFNIANSTSTCIQSQKDELTETTRLYGYKSYTQILAAYQ